MTAKRLLLIENDRLLSRIFRECLEDEDFQVKAVDTGVDALSALDAERPDAVVIDAVTPTPESDEVIRAIRAQESLRELPILLLPTARGALALAAENAGATKILPRTSDPLSELIRALRATLRFGEQLALSKNRNPDWLQQSLENAPETLNSMRRALHGISRDASDQGAARKFFQLMHGLSEQMAVLGQKPLFALLSAAEALAFDLWRIPSLRNAATLRTLGQVVDFAAILLRDEHRLRVKDPASADVLIVDDEDGARQMILGAMQFVNLKAMAADSPTSSLRVLALQNFDLIFLDVGLPEMSGFDLCTKIRSTPRHEKTPIVFLTGMATFQNRARSSLSGGNDFITKPFSLTELGVKAVMWILKGQLGMN